MSTKKYVEDMIQDLSGKIDQNKKVNGRRNFLYNLGTIFTGVLGLCFLGSQPWFALPVLGFAASLQLTKRTLNTNSQKSLESLIGQKEHLEGTLKSGLDVSQKAQTSRKGFIDKTEPVRKKQESEFYSALSGHRIGSGLVAAAAVIGGFVASPFVTVGSIAALVAQNAFDKKFMEKNAAIEDTCCRMNNSINDYNTAVRINNNRIANGSVRVNNNTRTNTNGNTRQRVVANGGVTSTYNNLSQADKDAVDAYIRKLAQQQNTQNGNQKRKV